MEKRPIDDGKRLEKSAERAVVDWKPEKKRAYRRVLSRDPEVLEQPPEVELPHFITLGEVLEEAKKRKVEGNKIVGLSSGYPSIDRLTKGFAPEELVVIFGHTSHGKSQLVQNIAFKLAKRDIPVAMFSLEMAPDEVLVRFLDWTDEETLLHLPIISPAEPSLTVQQIEQSLEHLVETSGIQMAIIDHLHYFSRSIENSTGEIGWLVREFKRMARQFRIPILLVSHIVKLSGGVSPEMVHLRDSSFIAQDSDIVLSVFRNREDSPDRLTVRIHKNRSRGFDSAQDSAHLKIVGTRLTEPILQF